MIPLRCPNCHQPLDNLTCVNGHHFTQKDGVVSLLANDFRETLEGFLANFEPLRRAEDKVLADPTIYPTLPFTPALQANPEWRMRGYDVAVLQRLLANRPSQRILDVGAWNGWLSHRLTEMGHRVTAVDYFIDQYDGLRAMQFYPSQWQAIQMDLTDLSVLDTQFDVVILNRCVQFFANPTAYFSTVREKVAPGGLLILIGLSFFKQTAAKAKSVADFHAHLRAHGFNNFKPMKGYLDFADKVKLLEKGVLLRPYPQLRLANLKSYLKPTAPRYYYGLYQA